MAYMTEQDFLKRAKQAIKICDDELQKVPHSVNHLQVVWMCHTLGYKKATFFDVTHLNEYFEVTYNRDKDEFYVDKYTKVYNNAVKNDEIISA